MYFTQPCPNFNDGLVKRYMSNYILSFYVDVITYPVVLKATRSVQICTTGCIDTANNGTSFTTQLSDEQYKRICLLANDFRNLKTQSSYQPMYRFYSISNDRFCCINNDHQGHMIKYQLGQQLLSFQKFQTCMFQSFVGVI